MDSDLKTLITNQKKEVEKFENKSSSSIIKKLFKSKNLKNPKIYTKGNNRIIVEKKNNKIEGFVIILYKNETVYIGEMSESQKNGHGIRTFQNTDIYYIGNYFKNQKHGQGRVLRISDDFEIYNGSWENDVKHGRGYYCTEEGEYNGEFVNDEMEGKGRLVFKNMDVFEGSFKYGVRQGFGILKFGNGDVYEGYFVDGLMHGNGVYIWRNGMSFHGSFFENQITNKGVLEFRDFKVFDTPQNIKYDLNLN